MNDVRRAYQGGLAGVIIGRALYEGTISFHDAMNQVKYCENPSN
jgi:phosphoribosylformimino-5-aminoimidazole carboxamide ribonucleotide (ProFAR) isomerase